MRRGRKNSSYTNNVANINAEHNHRNFWLKLHTVQENVAEE